MSGSKGSAAAGWFAVAPPPAAIQITGRRVTVVAMQVHGSTATVTGQSSEPLPAGLVTPALNAVNVHDGAALAAAIKSAVERVSPRPRRAALILPDTVAKISLVRFDTVPPRAQDLEQLMRWQVRKSAPFRIEDAQLACSEGTELAGGGREYLVEVARRDIVESYERACDAAGVHAGLVDVVSPNLVNAVLATQPAAAGDPRTGSTPGGWSTGDWLLVHAEDESSTLVVVRNGRVIFFRNRPTEGGGHEMGDLVHQTAMYYEDRLGGGAFSRVIMAGAALHGDTGELIRRQVAERLGTRVETLDVTRAVTLRDRIAAGPELLDILAPAAGVLLRDRVPAAASTPGERVAS